MCERPISMSIFAGVLASGVIVWLIDPSAARWLPGCPFRMLTGLLCPGCGTARALHSLVHGDLARAVAYNPYAVAVAPLLGVWAGWHGLQALGRAGKGPVSFRPWVLWLFTLLVIAFGIARNVPLSLFDAIRPPSTEQFAKPTH